MPAPFVGDVDPGAALVGRDRRGDAAGAVTHRVREQDVEHLADRAERRHHRYRLRARSTTVAAALAREDRLDVVDVLAHEVAEVEAADVAGPSGAREREQLLDDREQPRALLERGFGLVANLRIGVARELLDAQLEPGERGSELMARVLGEAALGAQQLLDALGAAVEGRRDLVDLGHAAARGRKREVAVAEPGRRPGEPGERVGEAPALDQREAERGAERGERRAATRARSARYTRVSTVSDGDVTRTNVPRARRPCADDRLLDDRVARDDRSPGTRSGR